GIPAIKVSDGPNGARGGGSLVGGVRAASFPVGIALGATWDPSLIEEIGRALAAEAHSKGARVLLAPTVNLHRSPLNGRNFECYAEDPFLTARLACAYIAGLQREGVAATIKHFVGNESEFERMTISSEIAERPLRELYLVPFEAAVKEAGVWALMSSYNRLNGTYVSEDPRLLRDILKGEWGFDGVVMSDWFATHSTADALNGGMDLEMPGPTRFRGERLVAAVESGEVEAATVRDSARRILRLIDRVGAFADPVVPEERAQDRPEDRALIRRAGSAGCVLLQNDGILPLDPAASGMIAVIGPNARTAQIMGGGSAQLNAHYRVSPFDGIAAQLGPATRLTYELGCTNYRLLPLLDSELTVEYFNSPDFSGDVVFSEATQSSELMWLGEVRPGITSRQFSARASARFMPQASGDYHFGLVSAGRSWLALDGQPLVDNWTAWQAGGNYFGAGSDEVVGVANLNAGQEYTLTAEYAYQETGALGIRVLRIGATLLTADEAIERAVRLAAEADTVILCVGANGEWDGEGQDRPDLNLPGRQDELIARAAAANPRTVVALQTGGPVAMPWLSGAAATLQAWYPGQECGNAIADVLFGVTDPGGRLPQTFPARLEDNPTFLNYPGENGRVTYGEGLFIGYRYYDKKRIVPLFPFGHGLSYTDFAYGKLTLNATTIGSDGTLTAQVAVTNTGARIGQEVVQLYVRDPQSTLVRPEKELKGFAKLELAPGETMVVAITLDLRFLAFFDDRQGAWVAEAGEFMVLVGHSSDDIRARATFRLTDTMTITV
ncbi:MAG TPA: glycoside hydrolase family 3 C-terminal domain-containing protein, partial [Thermomicrobiales bacterium]